MIRRNSMSLLQAMMEDMDEEHQSICITSGSSSQENPTGRSLRRSTAVDDSLDMKEEHGEDEDPPDLPTSPRPEIVQSVYASLSDNDHVEIVRQKRSFDLRTNRMFSPGGQGIRRVTSSTSRSSSTVQTPFTAADYDFSFWASNSPGISLHSPTRSTFFSSPLCSDADQEDLPRHSWSSRVVAHEESMSIDGWDTISTTMNAVDDHYDQSIDDNGGSGHSCGKTLGLCGRSCSTTHLMTSSDGRSTPLLSPGGRVSSQSESALDEMDDNLLIGGGDLGRTQKIGDSGIQPMCGLPFGDAQNDIQYRSLENIVTAVSPIHGDLASPMGEERWRERRRKSHGGMGGGEERRRSKAEITPSHSPSRDEEDECLDGSEGNERKIRLRLPSSLQQSLERIEGGVSYLGVEMESEEEEFHENDEYPEEDAEEELVRRNASADLGVIDEENDESRSRSVSRHTDNLLYGGRRPSKGVESVSSIDEPCDLAPCLSPAVEGDVSTCGSISYAPTPERETATSNMSTATDSSDMMTSSTTTSGEERRMEMSGHSSPVSLSHAGRTASNASTSPSEPEELAPGTSIHYTCANLSPSDETMPAGLAFHRRAISNHETRHEEMQYARRENEIVRARSSGGRSSMTAGRCLSQVMTPVSSHMSHSDIDSTMSNGRNLSSSDPALNELEHKEIRPMQQMDVDELQYDDGREARQPPPVHLPRKQSNHNLWRSPFAVATARGVMNPRVQVPSGVGPGAPPSREHRERHGTLPAGMIEREMEAEEKSPPLSGSPSSGHYDRGVLMRSSSQSAVGGFMRRSLRFLRGESAAAPLTPMTPVMYASSVSFCGASHSAPGAPTLARKDSAPTTHGGTAAAPTLRHTQSFDGDCLPPMWSPTPMDDDIEEEPGSGGRPRTPVRRAPHRRTLGAFQSRPSPAKDRLKLRESLDVLSLAGEDAAAPYVVQWSGERSRVKKDSGGSTRVKMFDSISNALFFSERKSKKPKTSDRSLDVFMQQFGMGNTVQRRRPTMNDGVSHGSVSMEDFLLDIHSHALFWDSGRMTELSTSESHPLRRPLLPPVRQTSAPTPSSCTSISSLHLLKPPPLPPKPAKAFRPPLLSTPSLPNHVRASSSPGGSGPSSPRPPISEAFFDHRHSLGDDPMIARRSRGKRVSIDVGSMEIGEGLRRDEREGGGDSRRSTPFGSIASLILGMVNGVKGRMSRSVSTLSLKERLETADEGEREDIEGRKMRYTPRMRRNASQKRSTKKEERIRWRKSVATREKELLHRQQRLLQIQHQDSQEADVEEEGEEECCSSSCIKPAGRGPRILLSMDEDGDELFNVDECLIDYEELARVQMKLLYFHHRSADDVRAMTLVVGRRERKRASSVMEKPRLCLEVSRRLSCSDLPTGGDRPWEHMVTNLYLKENTRQETLCVPDGVTIGATECLLPSSFGSMTPSSAVPASTTARFSGVSSLSDHYLCPLPAATTASATSCAADGCPRRRSESLRWRRRSLTPDPSGSCINVMHSLVGMGSAPLHTAPLASKWVRTRPWTPEPTATTVSNSTTSFKWSKLYHQRRSSATPSIQLDPPSKEDDLLEAEVRQQQQKRSLPWLLASASSNGEDGCRRRAGSPSPSVRSFGGAIWTSCGDAAKEKRVTSSSLSERRPSSSAAILTSTVYTPGAPNGGEMKRRMSNAIESLGRSLVRFKSRKSLDEAGKRELEAFARSRSKRRRSEGKNMLMWTGKGLPDEIVSVLEGEAHNHGTERSPSAVRSPNGAEDYSFELRSLSLCSDLWDRFGLFDQEIYSAWHEKYSTEGMSSKELKKQDAIFELIVQERRHCAHLAFLKKGYRQRLVDEHILSAGDADRLIPDVLDAMLAFHLHLLDRLVERQRMDARVDTVADIIAEELGDAGRFTTRAIDAYTSFGAAKESAEAYYSQLLNKGGRFAGFYNKLQADPNYRRYAYKTLLTVIIGRPTKYLLMLDQILKNEENEKIVAQTKEAAETARKFAARIDNGLQVCQMSKKWEEIKGQLEQGSKTMLHTGEITVPFTMDDLRRDTFANDSRKILCMGEVMVKQTTNQMGVYLILFDDILVVLQRKGGRMAFIQHEQAVLPVCSLHIRSTERQNSAFVISSCKPALLQFDFLNRNDRLKWVKVLETAIARAPKQVRMTPRSQSDSKQQARERAMEEERMRRAEDEWLRKLEAIFDERKPEEAALATYFGSRQKWFDELRRHVGEMPYRTKNEMPDKVRQTVRARFRELRAARVIPLTEMVERCTSAREGDLWAFFDDKHEITAGPSDDSDSSGSAKSGKQPRRIQTFHGTTSEIREKSSIRRHTTVPKMSQYGSTVSADGLHQRTESESEKEDVSDHDHQETREEREERMRMKSVYRVPLSLPLRARKASSRLVDDIVQLRLENTMLRNQAALDKTRIVFLERQRAPGYAAIVAPTETMEALRRKEQEVRDEETRVREAEDYGKAKLAQWQKELSEQKERLAVQEAELERKWLAYKEHTSTPSRSSSQKENGTPNEESRREKRLERTASSCSELSPALKGLSVKSETRRKK